MKGQWWEGQGRGGKQAVGVSIKVNPGVCAGEQGGTQPKTLSEARSPGTSRAKLRSIHLKLKIPKMALKKTKWKKNKT